MSLELKRIDSKSESLKSLISQLKAPENRAHLHTLFPEYYEARFAQPTVNKLVTKKFFGYFKYKVFEQDKDAIDGALEAFFTDNFKSNPYRFVNSVLNIEEKDEKSRIASQALKLEILKWVYNLYDKGNNNHARQEATWKQRTVFILSMVFGSLVNFITSSSATYIAILFALTAAASTINPLLFLPVCAFVGLVRVGMFLCFDMALIARSPNMKGIKWLERDPSMNTRLEKLALIRKIYSFFNTDSERVESVLKGGEHKTHLDLLLRFTTEEKEFFERHKNNYSDFEDPKQLEALRKSRKPFLQQTFQEKCENVKNTLFNPFVGKYFLIAITWFLKNIETALSSKAIAMVFTPAVAKVLILSGIAFASAASIASFSNPVTLGIFIAAVSLFLFAVNINFLNKQLPRISESLDKFLKIPSNRQMSEERDCLDLIGSLRETHKNIEKLQSRSRSDTTSRVIGKLLATKAKNSPDVGKENFDERLSSLESNSTIDFDVKPIKGGENLKLVHKQPVFGLSTGVERKITLKLPEEYTKDNISEKLATLGTFMPLKTFLSAQSNDQVTPWKLDYQRLNGFGH